MSKTHNLEDGVKRYYGRADLTQEILNRAKAGGVDVNNLSVDVMGPYDEFHIGGRKATEYIAKLANFKAGQKWLDVGSGVGGPARYFVHDYDLHFTGIDVTPEFCETAAELSHKLNLKDQINFVNGSATEMPFDDNQFDGATLLHVGMNIQNKQKVFTETFRVLKSGAQFIIYDVMFVQDEHDLKYPLPWSEKSETSHVSTVSQYKDGLIAAGFEIEDHESRQDNAILALKKLQESAHVTLKKDKIDNLLNQIESNIITPYIILCKRP